MAGTVAEAYGISPRGLWRHGTFNRRLDSDIPYYIDPRLLVHANTREMQDAAEDVVRHFQEIVTLLSKTKKWSGPFWTGAQERARFKEAQELGLGFGDGSTGGSGIGEKLGDDILRTMHAFVQEGLNDPHIFQLIHLVEDGIGADRISDMLGNIIRPRLLAYSERVFSQLNAPTQAYEYDGRLYQLPQNPNNGLPIVLVPREILRALPSYRQGEELIAACNHNKQLRKFFNKLVGRNLSLSSFRVNKGAIRRTLLQDAELAQETLAAVRATKPDPYDFDKDPQGEQRHVELGLQLVEDKPVSLALPPDPKPSDVHGLVLTICEEFKQAIEHNGIYELLYNDDGTVRPERQVQNVFHVQAMGYCKRNDIDISPEVDSGRGAVDFKFSKGFTAKVLVEIKKSSHTGLIHGLETQLSEYQKAEETDYAIFLVVDYAGRLDRKEELQSMLVDASEVSGRVPKLVWVDASKKEPASKYQAEHHGAPKGTLSRSPRAAFWHHDALKAPPPTPPLK